MRSPTCHWSSPSSSTGIASSRRRRPTATCIEGRGRTLTGSLKKVSRSTSDDVTARRFGQRPGRGTGVGLSPVPAAARAASSAVGSNVNGLAGHRVRRCHVANSKGCNG